LWLLWRQPPREPPVQDLQAAPPARSEPGSKFTIDNGDEAAAQLAARFAAEADQAVSARAGKLVERRGDEILAVFGSARQALRAAVELQTTLNERPLHQGPHAPSIGIGIGIDAGEAVPVDEGYRGAALNLAARLCSLAGPGEVLATATVTSLARRVEGLNYVERLPTRIKGFADPVTPFQITATSRTAPPPGSKLGLAAATQTLPVGGFLGSLPGERLAGRQTELKQLFDLVEEVKLGAGRLVMLAGEPGAGKTRLAQEITTLVHDQGFLIAAGCCYETRESTAFYPFRDVLATLYATGPAATRGRVAERWPHLARLVPEIPASTPPEVAAPEDQDRLFWSASTFIESITADRPVAILLDDLHWADASSLDLLQYLARRTRALPVLILATYRDTEVSHRHPLEAALREMNRQDLSIRIPVRRLDRLGIRSMVAGALDQSDISARFVTLLHERTEGNPFFIRQVLSNLIQHGKLPPARVTEAELQQLEVPESIRSVTAQRVGRLEVETQEILRVASVFGQTFRFDDLVDLTACDRTSAKQDQLEYMLEEATTVGLIVGAGDEAYAFDHALTQEALYRDLSSRHRRRLHRAAAEVIEGSDPTGRNHNVADLARHFLEGDAAERALPYLLAAADQSAAVSARSEAEAGYRAAIEVAVETGSPARLAEAHEKLGEVLSHVARYQEAEASFASASAIYRDAEDAEARLRVEVRWAYAQLFGQKPEHALRRLEAVLPELHETESTAMLASAYAAQARIFMAQARHEDQLAASEKAEKLARRLNDKTILASALVDEATALTELGDSARSLPLMEEAISIAGENGDDLTLWRALNNAGIVYREELGLSRAEEYHMRALEVAERSASPVLIAHARAVRGMYSWLRGEWIEASHWLEHAAVVARQLQTSPASWVLTLPAWIHVQKGREEEATRELDACIARGEELGDIRLLARAKLTLALQDLIQSRPAKALAHVQEAISEIVRGDDRCDLLLLGLEAALDLRQDDIAAEYVEELNALGRREPWSVVSRTRLQGVLAAHSARYAEAGELFARALSLARTIPFRLGEADVLRDWALSDDADGNDVRAQERLAQALEIYRDLGARPMADAVSRELLVRRQTSMQPLH
jgi:tetratricopeptide (TPR) repeat protein